MQSKPLTIAHVFFLAALFLALGLRLAGLGDPPLSDFEATWALQASAVANGAATSLGPEPGYISLTAALFFLLGQVNALARLLPALAGTLLVLVPWLFRRQLGTSAAILLAFGFALDPALVALSRQVGSPIPALSFTLLALGLAVRRQPVLAGLCAALALLSGPSLVPGFLGLALAWLLVRFLTRRGIFAAAWLDEPPSVGSSPPSVPLSWKSGLYFGLAVVLLVSTLFLRLPQGLGALAGALPVYLAGWTIPSGVPLLRLPAALLLYQPLIVLLGIIGAVRAWLQPSQTFRRLSLWALIALLLALLYPARQVSDLVWTLVPLWALAAWELHFHLPDRRSEASLSVALAHSALLIGLMVLIWFNLLKLSQVQNTQMLYWAVIAGVLAMGIIATLLIAAGWNLATARYGLVWGLSFAFGLHLFSGTWGMAFVRPNSALELWSLSPAPGQVAELRQTLVEQSAWSSGHVGLLDVLVNVDSPSLHWALRDFPQARFAAVLPADEQPAALITSQSAAAPSLTVSYRGQDFIWQLSPAWTGPLPAPLLPWITARQAPLAQSQLILWLRTDLFRGGTLESPSDDAANQPGSGALPAIGP